jgi:hypothetical protein
MRAVKRHRVAPGECLSSIAFRHGFAPDTLWNHPENELLRKRRPNMFQLVAGEDEVFIPDLTIREEQAVTARRHRFRRRGVPERLRFQFKDENAEPRAGLAYRLDVDGVVFEGKTDAEGRVERFIPPDAAVARVTLDAPDGPEEYELALGHDAPAPLDEHSKKTLRALGFLGEQDDVESVIVAVKAYQGARGLTLTGDLDLETTTALHGEEAGQR